MGELFSFPHLLFISMLFFMVGPLVIVPYWQIFKKAGFPPILSLLIVVPLVNLIVLYYVGFSEWKVGAATATAV